jgi:hypothetical protein
MRGTSLLSGLVALVLFGLPGTAHAECDASGVCVDNGKWETGQSLDDRKRRAEANKNKRKKDADLSVSITGGRASVFIDGVWVSEGPLSGFAIKPGRHDIQIRDGQTVIAMGMLTVPRKGGSVAIRVTHPSPG